MMRANGRQVLLLHDGGGEIREQAIAIPIA